MTNLWKLLQELAVRPIIGGVLLIFCGAALVLPRGVLTFLRFYDLREAYAGWLGAGMLLGTAILLANGAGPLWVGLKNHLKRRSVIREMQRNLCKLTRDEKGVLYLFIGGNTRTRSLEVTSGVVEGLVKAGVLEHGTRFFDKGDFTADYNLVPLAWEYLRKHPALLDRTKT